LGNFIWRWSSEEQKFCRRSMQIGDNGGEPKHLLNIHGVGYKLVA
jgi:hypothetical protein